MYDTEFWLWTIVPILNTTIFIGALLNTLRRDWVRNRRGKIVLAFTGTSFVASFVDSVITWLSIAKMEPGYTLEPFGLFLGYTVVSAWVAGIGLLALGLWKAYELFRIPKTDEKKE